ncbi:DUF2637 domain-containing protein [Streptomyces antibioticus]|uniref:DUF2637 domain-containing protein n=1 Tax=Streptomyces antibioticus TaxID=1890 RepID=UPI0033C3B81D
MTTTIEPPAKVPAPFTPAPSSGARADASAATPDVSATGPVVSAVTAPASATVPDVSAAGADEGLAGWLDDAYDDDSDRAAEGAGGGPQGSSRLRFWLGLAFLLGGIALGLVGFYLSFGTLSTAAHERFAFEPGRDSVLFALGVDGTIMVCLIGDLMFAAFGRSYWLLRPVAHAFTALTITLNAIAHGSILEHWDKALSHAAMPVVFVVLVEAGRHHLVTEAALEMGVGRDPIPWHRWLMHPIRTASVFRTMKTWGYSYTQVRTQRRELAVYEVWLAHREEIEQGLAAGRVGVLDRLPVLLAPHGVTIEQALALPARMKRAEQQRTQKAEREARELAADAARHARQLAHSEELAATAAEAARLKADGELARLRAEVRGATKVATAEAEGAAAAAELTASAKLSAAQRAAAVEEAAEESVTVAEAKRRAAETDRRAAEDRARAAEAREAEERSNAETAKAARRAAEETARVAEAERRTAEAEKDAAEARHLTAEADKREAEARARVAEEMARAAEAEALADMSATQIKTRRVARLLLARPDADGAAIAEALGGAAAGTAGDYKKRALALIDAGYDPARGYDPETAG